MIDDGYYNIMYVEGLVFKKTLSWTYFQRNNYACHNVLHFQMGFQYNLLLYNFWGWYFLGYKNNNICGNNAGKWFCLIIVSTDLIFSNKIIMRILSLVLKYILSIIITYFLQKSGRYMNNAHV